MSVRGQAEWGTIAKRLLSYLNQVNVWGEDTCVIKGHYVVYNGTIDVVQPLVIEGDRQLTAPMDAAKGTLLIGTQNR